MKQRWRVNDTLMLECSRPLIRFTTYGHSVPTVLWNRAVLKGLRGYSQVMEMESFTLYGAAVSKRGDVMRLSIWRDFDELKAKPLKPDAVLFLEHEDAFAYWTWDVMHHTWSTLITSDLEEFSTDADAVWGFKGEVLGFTGGLYEGKHYHMLPYWIAQEQANLVRTHRLPPAKRLSAYIELGKKAHLMTSYRLPPPYRPLLRRLLMAYRSYSSSQATTITLNQALSNLESIK